MLQRFTEVAAAIAATTKKNEKEKILADYLQSLDERTLERAVVFFAGSPFPRRDERVTGVGWSSIANAAAAATGREVDEILSHARDEGDLGDALSQFFPPETRDLSLLQLAETFDELAATDGARKKSEILVKLLGRVSAVEARTITKILLGEFRIGLQEGLVESAVARAFGQPLTDVRRAQMLNGDLGATALLARAGALGRAVMTLFHPIGFMLAQPEEDPEAIIGQLGAGALADDKYDGIRAQIHAENGVVKIYSRTLDQITARFPEVRDAASTLAHAVILDGELVAFRERILPFAVLQSRIGKRKPDARLLEEAPVVFFAFDLLYDNGQPLLDVALAERLDRLQQIVSGDSAIRRGVQVVVRNGAEVDAAFEQARARVNEGLVVKSPSSLYTPGRRGKAWLKYKKALATLDCVVTAAEYGHGKRRKVLSDYTFAVAHEGRLLNLGKAYSGLTDAEIETLTEHFLATSTARHGPVHLVEPSIVLEVAFDRIQESARHKSGFALRFPRIARIRRDKTVMEIATLDDVRRIYEGQLKREKYAQ